jgi:D-alanine-D-alanine ligase
MGRYDCVVLYNAANLSEVDGSQEKIYPSTVLREEVGAIEESLREGGYSPYVLSVDHFSKELVQVLSKISPKFVFNLCEEINGRTELEMCVAGLMDLMGIPYTGSGPITLGLALNKFHTKQVLRAAGLPSARGYLHPPAMKPVRRGGIRFPVIVKPAHEDASLGINEDSVCHDNDHLERQVAYIHDVYQQEALVEEYLDGREFNVSIIGPEPQVLAVSEIDFRKMPEGEPRIVSYRAKWDEESEVFEGTVPVCPAEISRRMEKRIKEIAIRSYRTIGCRDYARVDMRTDPRGNLYVLEVNPNPDISPKAGFARAARAAGLSYTDMVLRITQCALERGAKAAATVYAF